MQALIEPGQLTPSSQFRELPQGCLGSSGLRDLRLPPEFHRLGSHACDNCKLLAFIDLSSTPITEIREFTFSHYTAPTHLAPKNTSNHTRESLCELRNTSGDCSPTNTPLHCLQGLS